MESLNEAQGVGTKWAVDRKLGGNLESFVIRRGSGHLCRADLMRAAGGYRILGGSCRVFAERV